MHIATYAKPIHPVGNDSDWLVPPKVQEVNVKPPRQRPSTKHPRKQRIPSSGEEIVQMRCSRCSQFDHNGVTYKNPISLNPS